MFLNWINADGYYSDSFNFYKEGGQKNQDAIYTFFVSQLFGDYVMLKRKINAYMTVEAACLFPIILIVLMFMMYMIFFYYDRTLVFQNGAIALLYGKSFSYSDTLDSEVIASDMNEQLKYLNEGQLLALESLNQEITIQGNQMHILQQGTMKIPFWNCEQNSFLNFKEVISVKKNRSVFYIRQIRKVRLNEK